MRPSRHTEAAVRQPAVQAGHERVTDGVSDRCGGRWFRTPYAIIGSIADRGTSTCNAPTEAGNNTPWSKKKITPSLTTAKF